MYETNKISFILDPEDTCAAYEEREGLKEMENVRRASQMSPEEIFAQICEGFDPVTQVELAHCTSVGPPSHFRYAEIPFFIPNISLERLRFFMPWINSKIKAKSPTRQVFSIHQETEIFGTASQKYWLKFSETPPRTRPPPLLLLNLTYSFWKPVANSTAS